MIQIKPNVQAAAKVQEHPVEVLRSKLQDMGQDFKSALPPQINVERFTRIVMTAVQMNTALLEADRKSFFGACMKAAQDGLLPDGQEAALVTYKMQNGTVVVQYMPMVKGILKKVRNSGDLAGLTAQIVFENETFNYWVDDSGAHLKHEPMVFGDKGDPVGVYALATTKDGVPYIEVMSKSEVYDVKSASRAKNGPWNGKFEAEMWKKTAIRRLSKRLPMSTDLEQVIQRDDEMFDFNRERPLVEDKSKALAKMIGVETPKSQDEAPSEDNFQNFDEVENE